RVGIGRPLVCHYFWCRRRSDDYRGETAVAVRWSRRGSFAPVIQAGCPKSAALSALAHRVGNPCSQYSAPLVRGVYFPFRQVLTTTRAPWRSVIFAFRWGAALTISNYSPFRSAHCGAPRGTLLGSLPLWGRAWLHEAVAATGIDVGPTHGALLHRAPGLPLASVRPGRITVIDVRVEIGLCVGRHHPDG